MHFVLAVLALVMVSFFPDFAMATERPVPDGTTAQEQFEKAVSKYPYIAPAERMVKVKNGLKHVVRCMTKKQIRSLLGEPDYGEESYGPKGLNSKWIGSSWTFYLTKRADSVNTNDAVVQIFFDRNERASWVVPSHIENTQVLGDPGGKCP
jgi:hypothetical protein